MIDYNMVQQLTNQGIDAFSGGSTFELITTGGGTRVDESGIEYEAPESRVTISGGVRAISYRYIDGENIKFGDKRGFFSNAVPIENDMIIVLDGEHWRVVDNRPVNPTQSHVIAYRPILRKVAVYG